MNSKIILSAAGLNKLFSYFAHNALLNKVSSVLVNRLILFLRYFIKKNDAHKVLVIVLHKIGDTVFTLHAIKKIQHIYGDSISIICSNNTKVILEKCCANAEIFGVAVKDDFFFDRIAKPRVRKLVKEINPGIIIDITGNIKSATSILTAKARIISGFNERKHFTNLYTHHVEKRSLPKLLDMYYDPLIALHPLKITEEEKIFPVKLNPTGCILIHPFAGWNAKEWDYEKFIDLALKLNEKYNCKFVGEKSCFDLDHLNLLFEAKLEVIFTRDLSELLTLLETSSLFISNDSGPLYLANMMGKPTFTIYGPTNPLYSLPYGSYNRYIQNIVSCGPADIAQYCSTDAGRNGCKYYRCMHELAVQPVYDAVMKFINEKEIANQNVEIKSNSYYS